MIDLDALRIASPCQQAWADMDGDDRVRFCRACRLHVYNVSGMTRAEAQALIEARDGRLCVRFFRRHDGTILTRDCPAAFRRAVRWTAGVAASFLAVGGLLATGQWRAMIDRLGRIVAPPGSVDVRGRPCPPVSMATARVSGIVQGGGGERILVSLRPRFRPASEPTAEGIVVLRDGRFEPPVVAVAVGQSLRVENREPRTIVVGGDSLAPGASVDLVFAKPEAARSIAADGVTPLLVRVLAEPYFAWTHPDGSFDLPPAPPGSYELEIWRPGSDPVRRQVVLADGATLTLDLEAPR